MRTLRFSLVLLAIALPLCAQTKGPAPRLPDRTTDLSGVWQGGGPVGDIAEGLPKGESIPLLPEAEKILKARQSKDDPEANCLPTGVPRIAPYPWRIVQTPTHIFFSSKPTSTRYRQIFMDGRKHPADPDPDLVRPLNRPLGGQDTLVIDTVGFNDKFWFDFRGTRTANNCTRSSARPAPNGHAGEQRDDRGSRRLLEAVHGDVHARLQARATS